MERNLLVNGLVGDEREKALQDIKRAKSFLKRLETALQEELSKTESRQTTEEDFDCPSWALKQAYFQGYKRGLTKVLEYAKIKQS